MKMLVVLIVFIRVFNCTVSPEKDSASLAPGISIKSDSTFKHNSWQYFLQHLPVSNEPIKDYTGAIIANQSKHVAVVNYDIGNKDLQQCADALMRLRAEYLFSQKRFTEIGFHFCNSDFYSWNMYCKGIKPVAKATDVRFVQTNKISDQSHASLRSYLDIVYSYANTISLCKELKPAENFEIGTVIIKPGSPGHTCIIVDEATDKNGNKIFKLAEGYMPAQSIYILSNPYDSEISPWYHLKKVEILTASYDFTNYELKKFE